MKKIISLFALSTGLVVASCGNTATHSNSSKQVNETVTADEFDKKLHGLENVQLVDVRTSEEYKEAHLKNAKNYNINAEDFDQNIKTLDKTKPVLVYCLSGGRSGEAAEILYSKGFSEVYNLQGGIMKWSAANKPVEQGSGGFTVTDKGLSETEFIKHTIASEYVLVDYFAKWCKPCKKLGPLLDSLTEKKKDNLTLLKIDADENKELLKLRNIETIPYLELYKNGKLIWRHEGNIDETTLLKETNLLHL